MQTVRLGRYAVVAFTLSLMLLMGGMLGLGVAIQRGAVAPMTLDVRLGQAHLIADTTYRPNALPIQHSARWDSPQLPASNSTSFGYISRPSGQACPA
jgi:hypothetical protein